MTPQGEEETKMPGTRLRRGLLLAGRYELSELLGVGGMASVYLAGDRKLSRPVALKLLKEAGLAEDAELSARFRREAQAAASLSHPNVVGVFDYGEVAPGPSGGPVSPYIAMEYVPGGTLKQKIAGEGPFEPGEAAGLAAEVARALAHAHARGIVHRDVKPQNVLLTGARRVRAKVADFGIARALDEAGATNATKTSTVVGTAAYLSPEAALGKRVGPSGDLYSLGVTLYEMLTGVLPFEADNPIAVAVKQVNEAPVPPGAVNPRVPPKLEALTMRLLAKNPLSRPADAGAIAEELAALAVAPAAKAARARPLPPEASRGSGLPAMSRRNRIRGVGAMAAMFASAALVALALLGEPAEGRGGEEGPLATASNAAYDAADRAVALLPDAVTSLAPGGEKGTIGRVAKPAAGSVPAPPAAPPPEPAARPAPEPVPEPEVPRPEPRPEPAQPPPPETQPKEPRVEQYDPPPVAAPPVSPAPRLVVPRPAPPPRPEPEVVPERRASPPATEPAPSPPQASPKPPATPSAEELEERARERAEEIMEGTRRNGSGGDNPNSGGRRGGGS